MDDPKALALANKQLIREAIAGYAVAAEYIERERIERLCRMTPEQSRADYAIHSWLTVFANWLETDDIIDRFDQAWRKYEPEV